MSVPIIVLPELAETYKMHTFTIQTTGAKSILGVVIGTADIIFR